MNTQKNLIRTIRIFFLLLYNSNTITEALNESQFTQYNQNCKKIWKILNHKKNFCCFCLIFSKVYIRVLSENFSNEKIKKVLKRNVPQSLYIFKIDSTVSISNTSHSNVKKAKPISNFKLIPSQPFQIYIMCTKTSTA